MATSVTMESVPVSGAIDVIISLTALMGVMKMAVVRKKLHICHRQTPVIYLYVMCIVNNFGLF